MNILFLTLVEINSLDERGIYQDLLREFTLRGHNVFVVTPKERRRKMDTHVRNFGDGKILSVKTFNIQKTNILEKGIGTLSIEYQYQASIRKYFTGIKFDLLLYSTPPITFSKLIEYIKKRDNAVSYLLLKDIFPQNAVDIGLIKRGGLIHKFFKKKEEKLYALSDFIGCMSPANVRFVIQHNPQINPDKVEICPNSIELSSENIDVEQKQNIKKKYGIPEGATVFVYGGNLGKPQGLDFLLKVLESNIRNSDCFFMIVGSGTEYGKIKAWFEFHKPQNALLKDKLPKEEYDLLVQSCDVGLIFLDSRFTIPNYPSRLLSYLEYKMPVLMAIDKNTDIGKIAEDNGYGFWVENGDIQSFNNFVSLLCRNKQLNEQMGQKGYDFLKKNYTTQLTYRIIMTHFDDENV